MFALNYGLDLPPPEQSSGDDPNKCDSCEIIPGKEKIDNKEVSKILLQEGSMKLLGAASADPRKTAMANGQEAPSATKIAAYEALGIMKNMKDLENQIKYEKLMMKKAGLTLEQDPGPKVGMCVCDDPNCGVNLQAQRFGMFELKGKNEPQRWSSAAKLGVFGCTPAGPVCSNAGKNPGSTTAVAKPKPTLGQFFVPGPPLKEEPEAVE